LYNNRIPSGCVNRDSEDAGVRQVVARHNRLYDDGMTTKTTYRPKGTVASAQVVFSPTTEYGVKTEWAVELHFQSPTGDMSDFIRREIPCLDKAQAEWIANYWNNKAEPYSTETVPLDLV